MLPSGSTNPGQMTSLTIMHSAPFAISCTDYRGPEIGNSRLEEGPRLPAAWRHCQKRHNVVGLALRALLGALGHQGRKNEGFCVCSPNGEARVLLPGVDQTVLSGTYEFETKWEEDMEWPHNAIQGFRETLCLQDICLEGSSTYR